MSSSGPGDEQQPPQWQQPQWQQPPQDQPSWQQPQQDQPAWQQSQPMWGQQQQQWQAQPQTPGSATAALILGICGLLVCIICAPFAIVYGNKAKGEIAAANGGLTGGGLATAGVVLGWVSIGLWALFILIIVIAAVASA